MNKVQKMPSNKPLSETHKAMEQSDRKTEQYSSLKNLKYKEDNTIVDKTNSSHSSPAKRSPVIKSNSISDCSRMKTHLNDIINDHVCVVTFTNENDEDVRASDYKNKDKYNHVDSHPIIKLNDEDIDTISDKNSDSEAHLGFESEYKKSSEVRNFSLDMPTFLKDANEDIAPVSTTYSDETDNIMKKRANKAMKYRDSENKNNTSKKSKYSKEIFDKQHYVNLANNLTRDVNINSNMSSQENTTNRNNINIYFSAANRNKLDANDANFFLCDNYGKHLASANEPKLFHPPPITLTFERSESSSSLCETTILDPFLKESNATSKPKENTKMNDITKAASDITTSEVLTNNATPQNPEDELAEIKENHSYLKSYIVSMLQPSDNKLAMKLFGSKKGVLKEKLRQQKVSNWVIHPCSNFR